MYQVYLEDTEKIEIDIFIEQLINHYSIDGKYEVGKRTNVYGVDLYVVSFVTIYDPLEVLTNFMQNDFDVRCEVLYSIKDKKRV